jgi:hypothetical protein
MPSNPLADLRTEARAALDLLRRVQAHPDIPPKFGPILDSTIAETSRVLQEVLGSPSPLDDPHAADRGDSDPFHQVK